MTKPSRPPGNVAPTKPGKQEGAVIDRWYENAFDGEGLIAGDGREMGVYILNRFFELSDPAHRAELQAKILPALGYDIDSAINRRIMDDLRKIISQNPDPEYLLAHDEHLLDARFSEFIASVNDASGGQRRVVFVTHIPYFQILREAMYLRRNGHLVFLASASIISEGLRPLFESAFDGIAETYANLRLLRRLLVRLEPNVFHVQCWMWYYALGRAVIENKKKAAVVCEFYDVTSVYADHDALIANWPRNTVDFDFAMERYILERADAIVHRFPPFVIEQWGERHQAMPINIEFQSYPCKEFIAYSDQRMSEKDGKIRLVYTGNLIPHNNNHPEAIFPERGMARAFESIVKQGIAIDLLNVPHGIIKDDDPDYFVFTSLAKQHPDFCIMEGVPPDRLAKRIGVYDFGILFFDYNMKTARIAGSQRKGVIATKLFSYLEAGLPILVNAEYENMANFVTGNGLGIAVHSAEIGRLAEIIAAFDRAQSVKNIKAYNEKHSMEKEIHRLIALYDQIT